MDLGLDGASAVVTGGSKGMGRAIAQRLADEGARVAVVARGQEALDAAVDALHRAGSTGSIGLSVDVTDRDQVDAAFAEVGRTWGSLNVLVNTLGPGAGRFEQLDDRDWDASSTSGSWPPCGASGPRSHSSAGPSGRGSSTSRPTPPNARARSSWPTPRPRPR